MFDARRILLTQLLLVHFGIKNITFLNLTTQKKQLPTTE